MTAAHLNSVSRHCIVLNISCQQITTDQMRSQLSQLLTGSMQLLF